MQALQLYMPFQSCAPRPAKQRSFNHTPLNFMKKWQGESIFGQKSALIIMHPGRRSGGPSKPSDLIGGGGVVSAREKSTPRSPALIRRQLMLSVSPPQSLPALLAIIPIPSDPTIDAPQHSDFISKMHSSYHQFSMVPIQYISLLFYTSIPFCMGLMKDSDPRFVLV